MFFKDKKKLGPIEPPKEEDVQYKLKNFASLKPEIYLRIILSVICIIILLLFLFYPSSYARVKVTSSPSGAAVFANDKYVGFTPIKFKMPEGSTTITVKKPLYKNEVYQVDFKGRLLLFPKRFSFYANFEKIKNEQDYCNYVLAEFADFSSVGFAYDDQFKLLYNKSGKKNYYMSEVLVKFVKEFKDIYSESIIKETILSSCSFVTNEVQFQQIVLAWKHLYNIKSDLTAITDIARNCYDDYAYNNLIKYVKNSDLNFNQPTLKESTLKKATITSTLSLNGLNFLKIKGGTFTVGADKTKRTVKVDDFYILDREITSRKFNEFLLSNSFYNKNNIDALLQDNLVDDFYLDYFNPDSNNAITSVSYDIAKKFCIWLESLNGFNQFTVRLPYEAELELLTTISNLQSSSFNKDNIRSVNFNSGNGIYDIFGNGWEMCEDSWCENVYLDDKNLKNLPTKIKTVKGGSFVNKADDIKSYTRGPIFTDWCSPFTSFRVVLEKKVE